MLTLMEKDKAPRANYSLAYLCNLILIEHMAPLIPGVQVQVQVLLIVESVFFDSSYHFKIDTPV